MTRDDIYDAQAIQRKTDIRVGPLLVRPVHGLQYVIIGPSGVPLTSVDGYPAAIAKAQELERLYR